MENNSPQEDRKGAPGRPDWRMVVTVFGLLVVLLGLGFYLLQRVAAPPAMFVERQALKTKIETATKHRADLKAVKAIYNARSPQVIFV